MLKKANRFRIWVCVILLLLMRSDFSQQQQPAVYADSGLLLEIEPVDPMVALTFDDGPRASATPRLLDGLAERQAHATFFLVGYRIQSQQALVQRMAQEGHQIGVHTYAHVLLTELNEQEIREQVEQSQRLLTDILGEGEYWLRPPYGLVNDAVKRWAGGPIILWSVDPEDWRDHDVERITQEIAEKARDGDIILMHDIYETSVDAALEVIDRLQAQGFSFVTVEELLLRRGAEPDEGVVYYRVP